MALTSHLAQDFLSTHPKKINYREHPLNSVLKPPLPMINGEYCD